MSYNKTNDLKCLKCGACCIFYSISKLNKKSMKPCKYLDVETGLCKIYKNRPEVCSDFKADEICYLISSLQLDEKLYILKKIYS
ncbi:MAG: YkgJ family cysteine cluster protein [Deferribacterota bacterium]|nr:YkgJ family cysteine cluster protein [Deferribacterota bacterium]